MDTIITFLSTIFSLFLLIVFRKQIISFILGHLGIVILLVFLVPAFYFVSTMLAFTFYHYNVALVLGFSPFVTQETINLIIKFSIGIIFTFFAQIAYFYIHNSNSSSNK